MREQVEHRQALSDGTVLYVILIRRPGGWVSRFGIDGSCTADEESAFFRDTAEVSALIDGEELTDRATAPPCRIDVPLGYQVTGALGWEDGVPGWDGPLGIAVAGRVPPGVRSVWVDGVAQEFPVVPATGLFCAARTWHAAPQRATLRIHADDPAVEPEEFVEDVAEWKREMGPQGEKVIGLKGDYGGADT